MNVYAHFRPVSVNGRGGEVVPAGFGMCLIRRLRADAMVSLALTELTAETFFLSPFDDDGVCEEDGGSISGIGRDGPGGTIGVDSISRRPRGSR